MLSEVEEEKGMQAAKNSYIRILTFVCCTYAVINSMINLEKKIEKVDMIITVEEQLDCQTE